MKFNTLLVLLFSIYGLTSVSAQSCPDNLPVELEDVLLTEEPELIPFDEVVLDSSTYYKSSTAQDCVLVESLSTIPESTSYKLEPADDYIPIEELCKIASHTAAFQVPSDDNTFVYDVEYIYNPDGTITIRRFSTNRVMLTGIEYEGDKCCRVTLSTHFAVPEFEIPFAGFSILTTTVTDCSGNNPVQGSADQFIQWGSIPWQGVNTPASTRYKSIKTEFTFEVPCGECLAVNFTLDLGLVEYTLVFVLECSEMPCED